MGQIRVFQRLSGLLILLWVIAAQPAQAKQMHELVQPGADNKDYQLACQYSNNPKKNVTTVKPTRTKEDCKTCRNLKECEGCYHVESCRLVATCFEARGAKVNQSNTAATIFDKAASAGSVPITLATNCRPKTCQGTDSALNDCIKEEEAAKKEPRYTDTPSRKKPKKYKKPKSAAGAR